ncbi:NrdH-like redox domain-containing protein [Geomonas sp. Red69]|uniref:NrdH-like redox domain-containing protein n=1 Tax=Geomonas diazotrophica TaxID=2843197 RepID=A0ABX8JHJ9_9BACT|nr:MULTISPECIES: glutaredoxin domain-containing protein [Geomonas]MBU5636269.1 NrdH-like redox domain-containing protein [Geomonas diazotrophica]QWV96162.1 NrdH-like redox domain-containing protein [Geomonas nitrogeniifigens]QXE85229.1 NrdH-like redox domain-containing protein [Geomonas nitrogeniifigens]
MNVRMVFGMRPLLWILLALLLSTTPDVSRCEIFSYRDSKGVPAYVDDLGKVPKKYRSKVVRLDDAPAVSVMGSSSPAASVRKSGGKQQAQAGPKRFTGTIEIYWASYCPVCRDAESYMKKKNYPYVKYDVQKDSAAKERAEKYPGSGVPLIIVGSKTMRGFSPEALEQYMEE